MTKYFFSFLGILCVIFAIFGIILPILPTTPFLLLASWLFYKSSPKLRRWLTEHHLFGKYISNYIEKKGMPLKTKISTILLLWSSILLSIVFFTENLHLKILLLIVATGVTIHISLLKNP